MPRQKVSPHFIVKQSLKVFKRKGYADTRMEDIANACGLLKGSLYHHFKGGKKDLLKAVINNVHEYYRKEVFIHAYDSKLGAKQKLQVLVDLSENQFIGSDGGCLMGNLVLETASAYPEFTDMLRAFFTDWIAAMQHIFEEKHPTATANTLAKESVALIEGAVMMMRLFDDEQFLKQAHQQILQKID
jgi:TetR/AcrR family transcriptional repressor of lmrAB and yxaGH operons